MESKLPSAGRKIALRFFIYSAFYILVSDRLLYAFVSDPVLLSRLQTVKGWAYVSLASLIIFLLLSSYQREIDTVFSAQKETEMSLRHYIEDLDLLVDVSDSLRKADEFEEMLKSLLDRTLAALHTDSGAITVYDPKTDNLRYGIRRGWFVLTAGPSTRPSKGISGRVYTTGEPYRVEDFATDALTRPDVRPVVPPGWGGVCVPFRAHSHTVGLMYISVQHPRRIHDGELKILSSLADMAGTALHRTFLYEEAMRHLQFVQGQRQIDLAIMGSPELAPRIEVILEVVRDRLDVSAAALYLLDEAGENLIFESCCDVEQAWDPVAVISLHNSFLLDAIRSGEVKHITCDDAQEGGDLLLFPASGYSKCLIVPLITRGRASGLLVLGSDTGFRQDTEWLKFLENLAGQATIAIESAKLYSDLEQSRLELLTAYDSTIEGWSRALDLRDSETEGHSRRVADLALRLADEMSMSTEEKVHMRRGAMLHDVGKMAIPDSILQKPGSLSDEEWVVMRRHPSYAYEMLAGIEYLHAALDIPYSHHEKWDGSGYPHGLAGEEIPLAARVFAVVDVYDALLSDRSYRTAWSEAQVLTYIKDQKGAHFDPKVVDAFLELVGGGRPVVPRS